MKHGVSLVEVEHLQVMPFSKIPVVEVATSPVVVVGVDDVVDVVVVVGAGVVVVVTGIRHVSPVQPTKVSIQKWISSF